MKYLAIPAIIGGSFVAAELPNPSVGECIVVDVVATRTAPTMINPDGEVTGLRVWSVCGFQVPTDTGGQRAVDDTFVTDYDLDDAEAVIAAAGGLVDGNDVFVSNP